MDFEKAVLFEDNHLLIINKPSGYASLPNEGSDDIVWEAKKYLREKYQKKGNIFVHPIHRLDKIVSGILVMAKTSKALSRLNEQLRNKMWQKEYTAQLDSPLPDNKGTLVHYLCKRKYFSSVHTTEHEFTKKAILHYEHMHDRYYKIRLETGRYHQIRAQMGFMKSPICGDKKYGSTGKRNHAIDLHHSKLVMFHPISKEKIKIDSPPGFI